MHPFFIFKIFFHIFRCCRTIHHCTTNHSILRAIPKSHISSALMFLYRCGHNRENLIFSYISSFLIKIHQVQGDKSGDTRYFFEL